MMNYTVELKTMHGAHWAFVTVRTKEEAMEQKAYFEQCGFLKGEVTAWNKTGSQRIA